MTSSEHIVAMQIKNMTLELLSELATELPDDTDLEASIFGLQFIEATTILKWCRDSMAPYKKYIDTRDDSIFRKGPQEHMAVLQCIARIWTTLSCSSRNKIWTRLRIILSLIQSHE